jgi:hypothetical protein
VSGANLSRAKAQLGVIRRGPQASRPTMGVLQERLRAGVRETLRFGAEGRTWARLDIAGGRRKEAAVGAALEFFHQRVGSTTT